MSETAFIYTLIDPRHGDIRYVGQTNNHRARLGGHMSEAYGGITTAPVTIWIRELVSVNLRPTLNVVEVVPIDEAFEKEYAWYKRLEKDGCRLLNCHSNIQRRFKAMESATPHVIGRVREIIEQQVKRAEAGEWVTIDPIFLRWLWQDFTHLEELVYAGKRTPSNE